MYKFQYSMKPNRSLLQCCITDSYWVNLNDMFGRESNEAVESKCCFFPFSLRPPPRPIPPPVKMENKSVLNSGRAGFPMAANLCACLSSSKTIEWNSTPLFSFSPLSPPPLISPLLISPSLSLTFPLKIFRIKTGVRFGLNRQHIRWINPTILDEPSSSIRWTPNCPNLTSLLFLFCPSFSYSWNCGEIWFFYLVVERSKFWESQL